MSQIKVHNKLITDIYKYNNIKKITIKVKITRICLYKL